MLSRVALMGEINSPRDFFYILNAIRYALGPLRRLQRLHNVTADEMEMLACVARMGEIESPRAFVYILNAVRYALGR